MLKIVNDSPQSAEVLLARLVLAMSTNEKIQSLKLISTATSYISIQIKDVKVNEVELKVEITLYRDNGDIIEKESETLLTHLSDIKAVIFKSIEGEADMSLEALKQEATAEAHDAVESVAQETTAFQGVLKSLDGEGFAKLG